MSCPSLVLTSWSPGSTRDFGRLTATVCRAGDVVALVGDVGAGKTTYAQGMAEGLGVRLPVTSPTFVLVKSYEGDELEMSHIDLYRLESLAEAQLLDLDEYLYGEGVTVIEWADRFPSVLPEQYLHVTIAHEEGNRRVIIIRGIGRRGRAMVEEMRVSLDGSLQR